MGLSFHIYQRWLFLRIKRIKILRETATLKGVSISKLTKELGIKPAKRA